MSAQKRQIVPRCVSDRPILAPARHARINEPGIAGERHIGAEAKALHDAGPQALDEHVRFLDDPQAEIDGRRLLQIEHE